MLSAEKQGSADISVDARCPLNIRLWPTFLGWRACWTQSFPALRKCFFTTSLRPCGTFYAVLCWTLSLSINLQGRNARLEFKRSDWITHHKPFLLSWKQPQHNVHFLAVLKLHDLHQKMESIREHLQSCLHRLFVSLPMDFYFKQTNYRNNKIWVSN